MWTWDRFGGRRPLPHRTRHGLLEPHDAQDMLTWDHGGGFGIDAGVRIEKLREVIRRVRDEDLGLFITVSGLIIEIIEMDAELGFEPHTINLSCGVSGKVERLPANRILEFTTMCGHGLISQRLAVEGADS